MNNRLLNKASFLGLSLGGLVLAATLPAHAEPAPPDGEKVASTADGDTTKQSAPDGATQVTAKHVTLAADMSEVEARVNKPLLLTSSVVFAAAYAPTAVTAMANSKNTSGWLAVPVVGPWIDWGPNTSPGNKILLFTSGIFQLAGAAGIVTSFFVPEKRTEKVPLMGKRRFSVGPVAGRGVYAVSANGTF